MAAEPLSEDPGPPAAARPTPIWLVVVCTIAAGLVLAWFSNFLDSDETLKRLAARSFAPLLTQYYGDEGQKAITVLTIDEGDLKEYGLSWPVPLEFHGRLIQRIVKQAPKAIFLDVVFVDDRPADQVERLRQGVCEAAKAGVPVFYASYQRVDLSSNVELMLSTAVDEAGVRCATPVHPQVQVDPLDQHQWVYPLTPSPGPGVNERGRRPSSAARALHCVYDDTRCPTQTSEPMALLWPTRAAATNLDIFVRFSEARDGVERLCRGDWHWLEAMPFNTLARRLGHWLRGEEYQKRLPLCPYNQVVPASAFKGIGFNDRELADALRDRIVLIGTDLVAINDHVLSPVHGRLPGVHAHAVALDNLITLQGRYMGGGGFEWPWDGWAWIGWQRATLFSLASVCLVAVALVPFKGWQRRRLKAAHDRHGPAHFTSWAGLAQWVKRHGVPRGKALRRLLLGVLVVCLLAQGWSALGGPGRLLLLPLLGLGLWMLLFGQPVFGRHPVHRLALGWRVLELVVYVGVTGAIVWLGFVVFRQGPLVIVEYVGLTALAGVLGWGEKLAGHVHAAWCALSDPDPVGAWNRHAAEQAEKRLDL